MDYKTREYNRQYYLRNRGRLLAKQNKYNRTEEAKELRRKRDQLKHSHKKETGHEESLT